MRRAVENLTTVPPAGRRLACVALFALFIRLRRLRVSSVQWPVASVPSGTASPRSSERQTQHEWLTVSKEAGQRCRAVMTEMHMKSNEMRG